MLQFIVSAMSRLVAVSLFARGQKICLLPLSRWLCSEYLPGSPPRDLSPRCTLFFHSHDWVARRVICVGWDNEIPWACIYNLLYVCISKCIACNQLPIIMAAIRKMGAI